MASKDDDAGAEFAGQVVAMFIIMVVVVAVFSVINTVKVYNRLKPPDHPKHHLLKFLFGVPAALIAVAFLVSTSDPDTGFTIFFGTIIGYFVTTFFLATTLEAQGTTTSSAALKLENYLYPFELEPPDDRSRLPVQGYVLTAGERFEQAFRGLSLPPRGPEHDKAKLWEARVRAFSEAFKSG